MNVQELYLQLLKEGKTKKDAAKIAQEKTGFSVVTGKPINKQVSFGGEGKVYYGQYRI